MIALEDALASEHEQRGDSSAGGMTASTTLTSRAVGQLGIDVCRAIWAAFGPQSGALTARILADTQALRGLPEDQDSSSSSDDEKGSGEESSDEDTVEDPRLLLAREIAAAQPSRRPRTTGANGARPKTSDLNPKCANGALARARFLFCAELSRTRSDGSSDDRTRC